MPKPLTRPQSKLMYAAQGGRCASCGRDIAFWSTAGVSRESRNGYETCVDHDHVSGKVRGILCFHCNTALGHLFDEEENVKKLLTYISSHRRDATE